MWLNYVFNAYEEGGYVLNELVGINEGYLSCILNKLVRMNVKCLI